MKYKKQYNKTEKGYTLVEILVALLIFTTVIVSSISIMLRSSIRSSDNEARDRARTAAVRVLELVKKPDGIVCNVENNNEDINLEIPGVYSVADLDFTKDNVSDAICMRFESNVEDVQELSECENDPNESPPFLTVLTFPEADENYRYRNFDDRYCIQVIIRDTDDDPSVSSTYKEVTVNLVYEAFRGDYDKITLNGFR